MSLYNILIYGACFALMLATGIMVLLKDVKSPMNRAFFGFTITGLLWIIFIFMAYSSVPQNMARGLIFFRLTFGVSVLPILFLMFFFYHVPPYVFHFPRWVKLLLYSITSFLVLAGSFTHLIESSIYMSGSTQVDVFGPFYWLYVFYCLGLFIFIMGLVVKKILKSTGLEKERLIYISAGFLFFIFLISLTNIILPIFGIVVLQNESVAFSLFFFMGTFYSIYKQRFFNFTFLSLYLLRRFLLILFFLAAFSGIYLLLRFILPSTDPTLNFVITSLSSLLIYHALEAVFPDFYSAEFRHFKKAIAELNSMLFNCTDYNDLVDLLRKIFTEKLSYSYVKIFTIREYAQYEHHIPSHSSEVFTDFFKKRENDPSKAIVVTDEFKSKKDRASRSVFKELSKMDAVLCLPLFAEEKVVGFLILGDKGKHELLSREEINEIFKLRRNLETAFMNILINSSLREENDLMKKIITDKTDTLKANNEKLEQMIRQQDNFISLTAHEFKNPLSVALLGLEQISYVHKKNAPGDLIKDVETSYNQLNKLTLLINHLLEMRRVEDDKIPVNIETFNLMEVIIDATRSMKLLADQRKIKISYKGPKNQTLMARSDRIKLQQILNNLIQNAFKFTPEKGRVKLELFYDKKRDMASVSVHDNGMGIPKEKQEVIFNKFQQGGRQTQGVGIGLYICSHYIQLLRGVIEVKSAEGKGSVFTIHFPLHY